MELQPFVKQFTMAWACLTGLMLIMFLLVGASRGRQFTHTTSPPHFFVPLFLLIFGIYLPVSGFKLESQNSKEYLSKLLEEQDYNV